MIIGLGIALLAALGLAYLAHRSQNERQRIADVRFDAVMKSLQMKADREAQAEVYSNGKDIVVLYVKTDEIETEFGIRKTYISDRHLAQAGYEAIGDLV